MESYRVAEIFTVIFSCYYLISLISVIAINVSFKIAVNGNDLFKLYAVGSVLLIFVMKIIGAILYRVGVNTILLFTNRLWDFVMFGGIVAVLVIAYVLIAHYYQACKLSQITTAYGLACLEVSHNAFLYLFVWPYLLYKKIKSSNRQIQLKGKLKMNPLWSLGLLIIAAIDVQIVINSYQMQTTVCDPDKMTGSGLTELTCLGVNYQLSIVHLVVVLFTLIIFNLFVTNRLTKVVIVMIYLLTVDAFIGSIIIYLTFWPLVLTGSIYLGYKYAKKKWGEYENH